MWIFSNLSILTWPFQGGTSFLDHLLFMSCVCHAFASVHCCFVVTCRGRDDLLTLVCDDYWDFVTFPFGILRQVWYLIVWIPDPCCLSYFILEIWKFISNYSLIAYYAWILPIFMYVQLLVNKNEHTEFGQDHLINRATISSEKWVLHCLDTPLLER